MMVMDLMHEVDSTDRGSLAILVTASLLKDDLPWIYELGLEAYREAQHKKSTSAQMRFSSALRAVRRGPWSELVGDKETYMMIRDIEHLTEEWHFDAMPHRGVGPSTKTSHAPKKAGSAEDS